MVALEALQAQFTNTAGKPITYGVTQPLNLYDSSALKALATQAHPGRKLRFQSVDVSAEDTALAVVLWEDDYPGWISPVDLAFLETAAAYSPVALPLTEIKARIPRAIAFAQAAMTQPNFYLWGGTLGPNYDCSGLVQHAFSAQGIWLPRDAYQQETFVQNIENPGDRPEDLVTVLEPGDLLFFGTPIKATHVAIYLGEGTYIHSSGKDQGRNGIGIDSILNQSESVSRNYYAQVRGAGRVVKGYHPKDGAWNIPV